MQNHKAKASKVQMRKMFTKNHIYLDMFGISVYFTKSEEEFRLMCEWVKSEAVLDVGGRTMLHQNEDGSVMVYLGWFNDDIGTLAHECTHAALFICEAIGHNVEPHDELSAYLCGHLVRKCLAMSGGMV